MAAEGALKKPNILFFADLTASVPVVTTSANKLESRVVVMQACTAKGVVRVRDVSDRLVAALTRVQQARKC